MQRSTGTLPRLIGKVVPASKGVRLVKEGKSLRLDPRGWDHFK
jgi:thiamine monophosphate kinase